MLCKRTKELAPCHLIVIGILTVILPFTASGQCKTALTVSGIHAYWTETDGNLYYSTIPAGGRHLVDEHGWCNTNIEYYSGYLYWTRTDADALYSIRVSASIKVGDSVVVDKDGWRNLDFAIADGFIYYPGKYLYRARISKTEITPQWEDVHSEGYQGVKFAVTGKDLFASWRNGELRNYEYIQETFRGPYVWIDKGWTGINIAVSPKCLYWIQDNERAYMTLQNLKAHKYAARSMTDRKGWYSDCSIPEF